MIQPELFDVVELLVNLPEDRLHSGDKGAIVECYSDRTYEVEFTNEEGETVALRALSDEQFIVVWKASTNNWLSISEKITAIINHLPERSQEEVLEFAGSLYRR
ncbi:DUF4926 domain-containing protein [Microcoleus sp. ARI1-B5]|uniref:DUF4926 domain-containing protein n=1 Tax=unclassified Microcoleus TaxID=2642155 RepID=UPI002FD10775